MEPTESDAAFDEWFVQESHPLDDYEAMELAWRAADDWRAGLDAEIADKAGCYCTNPFAGKDDLPHELGCPKNIAAAIRLAGDESDGLTPGDK